MAGAEVGFYAGCVRSWQALRTLQETATQAQGSGPELLQGVGTHISFNARTEKSMAQLEELIRQFPLSNPQVCFRPSPFMPCAALSVLVFHHPCRTSACKSCSSVYAGDSKPWHPRWECCRTTFQGNRSGSMGSLQGREGQAARCSTRYLQEQTCLSEPSRSEGFRRPKLQTESLIGSFHR